MADAQPTGGAAHNKMRSTASGETAAPIAVSSAKTDLEIVKVAIESHLRWMGQQTAAATQSSLNLNPPRNDKGEILGKTSGDLNPFAEQEVMFREMLQKVETAIEEGAELTLQHELPGIA